MSISEFLEGNFEAAWAHNCQTKKVMIYSSMESSWLILSNMLGIRPLLEKILQLPADSSFMPSYVLANENKVEWKAATASIA